MCRSGLKVTKSLILLRIGTLLTIRRPWSPRFAAVVRRLDGPTVVEAYALRLYTRGVTYQLADGDGRVAGGHRTTTAGYGLSHLSDWWRHKDALRPGDSPLSVPDTSQNINHLQHNYFVVLG